VPATSTEIVHGDSLVTSTPATRIVEPSALASTAAESHAVVTPFGVATARPAGNATENLALVTVPASTLAMTNVNVDEVPADIESGEHEAVVTGAMSNPACAGEVIANVPNEAAVAAAATNAAGRLTRP
jgi:hypothetical protein